MTLGPYASFIVISYLLVTMVVLMLIAWIGVDYRRQKQRLRELEASGIIRRSGRGAPDQCGRNARRVTAAKAKPEQRGERQKRD